MGYDALPRGVRLVRLQHLLFQSPHGLTARELAQATGVHPRTIQRDLRLLEDHLKAPLTQDGRHYSLLHTYPLPPLTLTLYEAAALLLAARSLWRQSDKRNPHAVSAFEKLALALPEPMGQGVLETARSLGEKAADPELVRSFEVLVSGWTGRRKVRLRYTALDQTEPQEHVFHTYTLETSGTAFSLYAVGFSELRQAQRTLKLERISGCELLTERFDAVPEAGLHEQLASGWGVVWGEETSVRLRFSPRVARRVHESVWHHSQTLEDLPNGGCLLSVTVAGLMEITPWIRGWGPDVEVLDPPELRERIADDTRRAAALYGPATTGEAQP